jgi:hypothetical protein
VYERQKESAFSQGAVICSVTSRIPMEKRIPGVTGEGSNAEKTLPWAGSETTNTALWMKQIKRPENATPRFTILYAFHPFRSPSAGCQNHTGNRQPLSYYRS